MNFIDFPHSKSFCVLFKSENRQTAPKLIFIRMFGRVVMCYVMKIEDETRPKRPNNGIHVYIFL